MRLLRASIIASFLLAVASCGGDDPPGEEAYDTLQDCYTDHHDVESNSIIDSIKICCIDHPIAGQDANVVCGETQNACETFVDDEIADVDVIAADITTACEEYLVERDL